MTDDKRTFRIDAYFDELHCIPPLQGPGAHCTLLHTKLFVFVHLHIEDNWKALSVKAFSFGIPIDNFCLAADDSTLNLVLLKNYFKIALRNCGNMLLVFSKEFSFISYNRGLDALSAKSLRSE